MSVSRDTDRGPDRIVTVSSADVVESEPFKKETGCCAEVLPSIGWMAQNLAGSAIEWAKSGFKLAEQDEQQRRWALCQQCPELLDGRRCIRCGCYMELKSRLEGMKCPDGHW
jgi:hypothetical protein